MFIKMEPLVSIIIPCYNVSSFIDKAIRSILSQTYSYLEIWIIDDASTDDTLQKINAFKDDRIKVVSFKENTKKVGAVNEVLQKVNGEYIAFQDADDWSEPERIEQQLKEFAKDAALGICFTNYRYVGKKAVAAGQIALTNEDLRNEFLNYTYKRKPGTTPTICATMMITKEALDKTGGYHPYFAGRVAEDIQWIYRIMKDFKGITIDKVLYNYCVRPGSLTEISSTGKYVKSSYSVQLLSKIINKDIYEGIDILNPENSSALKLLELEACEDALAEAIHTLNETKAIYKGSMSFKLGRFILRPLRLLRRK